MAQKDYFDLPLRPAGLSASSPVQRGILWLWEATLKMRAVNEFAAAGGVPEADRAARVRAHVDLTLALSAKLAG